jgi:hypothetical protein
VAGGQRAELFASGGEECIAADYERAYPQLDQGCEDRVEVAFSVRI